ncbi:MAG: glycoside hydrolase, partial [Prolixibacteraceae bacterium]|nr:glycoside hydrolase [Prolixibacteraceae bacterium]
YFLMKNKIRKAYLSFTSILIFGLFLLSFTNKKESIVNNTQHGIVYYKEGNFAGWPANNGIWLWGNEILVGFVVSTHKEKSAGHSYDPAAAVNKYARSKDGGKNWVIEDAFEHGQTAWGHDNNVDKNKVVTPVPLTRSIENFTSPDCIFTIQRHNNHNGPSHFYYSENRGRKWNGPFSFPDLGTDGVASRTDCIIDGEKELSVFLTVAKGDKKEGRVALSRTKDGGVNWEIISWIGSEPEGFDIMPSSVRLSPAELLTVIRTRTGSGQDLLTSYLSEDNGITWERLKDPVADTGKGGSPPALVKLEDGRLALAYIYRSEYGSRVNIRFSSDKGRSWSDEIVLRSGDGANRDVGYPRMVQRPDGKLVLIYYWNNANQDGAKPYRYIASTIVDPARWK